MSSYYERNKEKVKARVAAYRAANPEKTKAAVLAWYAKPENKAKRCEYFKTYSKKALFVEAQQKYRATPEGQATIKAYGKKWRTENPGKNNAKSNRRRAEHLQRTPGWLSSEDEWLFGEIYELAAMRSKATGVKHHVDHIIPLKGRLVSGLHVPTNLQVIPARDNLRKHAKYAADA